MIGTLLVNLISAFIGFLLAFAISLSSNTLITSFVRGSITFVAFFLLAFIFRWVLNYSLIEKKVAEKGMVNSETSNKKESKTDDTSDDDDKPDLHDENRESSPSLSEEEIRDDAIKRTSDYVRELLKEDS